MKITEEQEVAERYGVKGPMDRIRQKRKGERAYTNDEIARFESLRAELRAFDDPAQIDRLEKAVAALRGGAQQAVMDGTLTFGAAVENIAASDRNPIKRGIFIRKTSRTMAEYATKEGCHSTPLDNLRAIAPLPQVTEGDHWQSIATAPDDGRKIWAFGGRYDKPSIVDADGDWWRFNSKQGLSGIPTHWQPLLTPSAPVSSTHSLKQEG